jgi:hypothetical protein
MLTFDLGVPLQSSSNARQVGWPDLRLPFNGNQVFKHIYLFKKCTFDIVSTVNTLHKDNYGIIGKQTQLSLSLSTNYQL